MLYKKKIYYNQLVRIIQVLRTNYSIYINYTTNFSDTTYIYRRIISKNVKEKFMKKFKSLITNRFYINGLLTIIIGSIISKFFNGAISMIVMLSFWSLTFTYFMIIENQKTAPTHTCILCHNKFSLNYSYCPYCGTKPTSAKSLSEIDEEEIKNYENSQAIEEIIDSKLDLDSFADKVSNSSPNEEITEDLSQLIIENENQSLNIEDFY